MTSRRSSGKPGTFQGFCSVWVLLKPGIEAAGSQEMGAGVRGVSRLSPSLFHMTNDREERD